MSNVFSSEFWRSLYFRAMGGQASEAAAPTGEMSAVITGGAQVIATLSLSTRTATDFVDTHDGKRREVVDQNTLRALARAEEEAEQARRDKERKSKFDLRRILGRVLGEPEPETLKPVTKPVEIAPAPEPEPESPALVEAEALALKQKEEDDALIILLLAA